MPEPAYNASYRTLNASRIVETLDRLEKRVAERFPVSGLRAVCRELAGIARSSAARAAGIGRANLAMRIGIFAVIAVGLAALGYVGSIIKYKKGTDNLYGVLQGIDALFNVVLLLGGAIFFLSTIESRWKRYKALEYLHELRSVIHVIDMHQLTKDPSVTLNEARRTKSSPERAMSAFELVRYLDYCSEMLSLAAKVAVLYAQSSRDTVVINAVTEIEQISANLSAKVWQKITLIEQREIPPAEAAAAPQNQPGRPTA